MSFDIFLSTERQKSFEAGGGFIPDFVEVCSCPAPDRIHMETGACTLAD